VLGTIENPLFDLYDGGQHLGPIKMLPDPSESLRDNAVGVARGGLGKKTALCIPSVDV